LAKVAQLLPQALLQDFAPQDADDHISMRESHRAVCRRKRQRTQLLQMPAVPTGKRGRDEWTRSPQLPAHPARRRISGTPFLSERVSRSSRLRKLGQKRVAAAGSRKVYRRREVVQYLSHLQDFGEHARWRANGMSPIVDHQSTVNRSSCGRRTSLTTVRRTGCPACSGVTYIYSCICNLFASWVPHSARSAHWISLAVIADNRRDSLDPRWFTST
jgi:hypothetical protein